MGWNHRVLVIKDGDDYWYQIHEVYYDQNGVPESYTMGTARPAGNDVETLNWTLDQMKDCLNKPFLWGDDRFPEEFKE